MPTYAFPTTTAGDHHRQQTPTHTSHSHRHSQSHSYSVSHVSSASQSHWPVDPHTRVNAHGLPFDYASEHAHINGLNFYNLSENLSEPDWIGGTSAAAESSAMYLSHMPQHQSHVMGHTNMDLASAYSNQPHQSNQHLGAPSQEILRQSLSAEDLTSTHCYTGYETSTSNDGSHYDYPGYFHSNCLSPSPATSPPGSSVQGGQIIAAQRNCPFRCPFYLNSPGDYPQCRDLTFRFMSRIRMHISKHTFPHECSTCFKRFSTPFSLRRHSDQRRRVQVCMRRHVANGVGGGGDVAGTGISEEERTIHQALERAESVEEMVDVLATYGRGGSGGSS